MVGDEDDEGRRVGRAEVGVDGGEFFFFAAAAVEGFQVADEEDLEGRHERWGLGAVEDLEDGGVGEVEIVEAEVAGVGRGEGVEDGVAAAVVEEDLVAEEDVAGADGLRGGDFGDEAVGGRRSCGVRRLSWRARIRTTPAYRLRGAWAKSRATRRDGGGVFLDEAAEVLGGLVLLAVDDGVVLVEDVAVVGGEDDLGGDGDEIAGGLAGGGVVGEGSDGLR